ncbi:Superfamily I DNA and RNA helicase, putative [Babesia ovata]|uniref:Superfamily I DNA and RNA helicase, putative n=1 Tax=Babesia ovata TaxID=189622 RepID=A0A2H6KAV2_9APIC|nr:Superfamily I DNA and RNA helicase, putative [Babesia ovata]GBE60123.1 Superfamily I DNA and RNA helicase, putative [Babesia ovata]
MPLHARHAGGVHMFAAEHPFQVAALDVPYVRGVSVRARAHLGTVLGHGHVQHGLSQTLEKRVVEQTQGRGEQRQLAELIPRNQKVAVGRPFDRSHASSTHWIALDVVKLERQTVPHDQLAALAAGQQRLAIGEPLQAYDGELVAVEGGVREVATYSVVVVREARIAERGAHGVEVKRGVTVTRHADTLLVPPVRHPRHQCSRVVDGNAIDAHALGQRNRVSRVVTHGLLTLIYTLCSVRRESTLSYFGRACRST